MKFLIVFSVLAICAINVNGTFSKHFNKGGSSAGADTGASSGGHGGGGGGLASIGKILAIPLGIKQKLLLSHQKKINQKFDKIIGALSKFGSHGSSSGGEASVGNEVAFNGNVEAGNNGGSNYQESSEYSGGSVQTQSGIGLSTNGGASYDAQYDSGSNQDYSQNYNAPAVQSYHPQPATQTQYKEVPVTVHLYQVEAQPQAPVVHQRFEPQAHIAQPSCDHAPAAPVVHQRYEPQAPVFQQNYEPAPAAPIVHQRYEPQAPVFQQNYEPAPAAPIVHQRYEPQVPAANYGVPDYQPSAPIVEKQVIQQVGQTYLPPIRKRSYSH